MEKPFHCAYLGMLISKGVVIIRTDPRPETSERNKFLSQRACDLIVLYQLTIIAVDAVFCSSIAPASELFCTLAIATNW